MNKNILKQLEYAWSDGFFFNLRNGTFEEQEYEKLKICFDSLKGTEIDFSNKRVIELLWFIPLFILWQEERLTLKGMPKDKFDEVFNFFYNECEDLLGLP